MAGLGAESPCDDNVLSHPCAAGAHDSFVWQGESQLGREYRPVCVCVCVLLQLHITEVSEVWRLDRMLH